MLKLDFPRKELAAESYSILFVGHLVQRFAEHDLSAAKGWKLNRGPSKQKAPFDCVGGPCCSSCPVWPYPPHEQPVPLPLVSNLLGLSFEIKSFSSQQESCALLGG